MLKTSLILAVAVLTLGACSHGSGPPAPYSPSPDKVTPPPPPMDVIRPKV